MAGNNSTVIIVGTLLFAIIAVVATFAAQFKWNKDKPLVRLYGITTFFCVWFLWLFCVLSQLYPLKFPQVIIESEPSGGF